jgi:hypothetical protein
MVSPLATSRDGGKNLTMKKLVATIYWMFKTGDNNIPYLRTMLIIILGLATQIALLFNIPSRYIFPWSPIDPRPVQWLNALIYLAAAMTILILIFKRGELESITISAKKIQGMKRSMRIYFFLSIGLTVMLAIYHREVLSK